MDNLNIASNNEDPIFTLGLANDLDDLENQWKNWMQLTYDERKISDMKCMELYGCNNQELYESLKSKLSKIEDINEDFSFTNKMTGGLTDEDREIISKYPLSVAAKAENQSIILIDDVISTKPKYTLDDLNDIYNKFNLLTSELKNQSNGYSIRIWGKTVQDMFEYVKNKISTDNDEKEIYRDMEQDEILTMKKNELEDAAKKKNFVEFKIGKIDCMNANKSVYEKAVLENTINKFDSRETFSMYNENVGAVTPFYTPDEIKSKMPPYSFANIEKGQEYIDTIKKLIEAGDFEMVNMLGWNPYVAINEKTITYARNKQLNWLKKNSKFNVVDLSNFTTNINEAGENIKSKDDLYPVYIIIIKSLTTIGIAIRAATKSEYSHAGMAFDTKLDKIYSYTIKDNGFTLEKLSDYKYGKHKDKTSTLHLSCIFVDKPTYDKLLENAKYYVDHKDYTTYNTINLINILFNKVTERKNDLPPNLVCSQFVDVMLKAVGIDITDKPSSLVAPSDLDIDKNNIYVLFHDDSSKYKYKEIDKKVKAIKRSFTYDQLITVAKESVSKYLNSHLIENLAIQCDDESINEELRELQNFIKIHEIKSPIGFEGDGDLYITLPKNLQREYNEAHQLLLEYDKANNYEGMKQEISRLFYINSIIETKLGRMNKNDKDYKTLIDLRARVINDFKKYLRKIQEHEPNFDFYSYFKKTEYYNKEIVIDGTTLKFTAYYVKKLIKLILEEY